MLAPTLVWTDAAWDFLRKEVREPEPLPLDHVPDPHRDRPVEHRPGVAERVELAVLPARIDAGRQVREQLARRTPGPRTPAAGAADRRTPAWPGSPRRSSRGPAPGVSAGVPQIGNSGSSPVPASCRSRYARMSARNRSPNANAVTPSDRAFSTTARIRASYSSFEHGHGSGTGHSGKPGGVGLRLHQFRTNPVHGDPPERLVQRGHQPDDLDLPALPQDVQRPGRVLARTPRQQDFRLHASTASPTPSSSRVSRRAAGRPGGSGCRSGRRAWARISTLSTSRGPGRLK